MKVIIFASYPQSLINFRGSLIRAFLNLNLKVIIICPVTDLKVTNVLKKWGCDVVHIKLERRKITIFNDIFLIFKICYIFYIIKPDLLFCYTQKPVIYSGLVCSFFTHIKFYPLITGLGFLFQYENNSLKLFQSFGQKLLKLSLLNASKVFFQNPDDKLFFHENRICCKRISSVVLNGSGVDINFYKPTNLPSNFSFLLIARLIKAKGIIEFVEAAELVSQHYDNVSFRIVGWSESGVDIIENKVVDGWTNNRYVEFLGSLEDVRPAIADSSVYVLPSYREGTPRTVLEAMAMGRAIITTDVPGCRETVIDGHNGYLVPPRDSKALSQAMSRFLDEPSLALEMGRRSREMAVEKYDVEKVNKIILKELNIF